MCNSPTDSAAYTVDVVFGRQHTTVNAYTLSACFENARQSQKLHSVHISEKAIGFSKENPVVAALHLAQSQQQSFLPYACVC